VQTSAFMVKLDPAGTLVYSTLLNGHPSMATVPLNECGPSLPLQCDEPRSFASQNYATGIALDPAGNIVVTGGTRSVDFPTAHAMQSANAGGADAFLAVISADGSQLQYSSYLGGSLNDGAVGVAADRQGNVIVAGLTSSPDFLGGTVPQAGSGNAFVARVISGPPTITAVLNAASYQPGIQAGSWVMIKGSNLANTTGIWQSSDFVGDNLPTVVDGVSVTIDGRPAYVEYVSPTQINVVAPTDTATGPVKVVVNNNGLASAPATAQLQTVAPASGAPATATPVVTVGGLQMPVISSVLTTGAAGLYQITIQLPANVPTGTVAVQASIAGAQTQPGVRLFVGAQ